MQARSNTLNLRWRGIADDKGKDCLLCGHLKETLTHFLIECPMLQEARNKYLILQLPKPHDSSTIIRWLLLLEDHKDIDHKEMINAISDLWGTRNKLITSIEN